MKTRMILISGKQGSGKTTIGTALGEALHKRLNWDVEQVTFASTIYDMHDGILRILKDRGIERDIVKDGPLLQLLGTEWGRNTLGEEIWVNCLKGEIANKKALHLGRGDTPKLAFIATDCRFQNELHGFHDALRVRLECDKSEREGRCSMWRENDSHVSETDLDGEPFDLTLHTDSTPIAGCVDLILSKFQKDDWIDRRGVTHS